MIGRRFATLTASLMALQVVGELIVWASLGFERLDLWSFITVGVVCWIVWSERHWLQGESGG